MALVINTNVASDHSIRMLNEVARSQAKSMEKLTTGLRINHASDDASGVSVVANMHRQIQGLAIATNNANDGINIIQLADGALEDSTEFLQRMRELGIQAMNATYSSAQRSDMNEEFQMLNHEITRIASVTKFNNISVLKGSTLDFQVGWEIGDNNKLYMSGMSLTSINANVLTQNTASDAVASISGRLQSIQTRRAKWGAVVNRLENAISNMNNMSDSTKASLSRFQDTDYVKESANLARTTILQQAGLAMLAQSNQTGQNVLSLLR